jgi:hypothetical protein
MSNFICNNFGNDKSDIPLNLVDNSTFMVNTCKKYHTLYTYLFCVILRIIIGIFIYNSEYTQPMGIILWCAIIIMGFYSKCVLPYKTWKKYCRIVTIYASIILVNISKMETKTKKELSGMLIILDALFGLKSRYDVTKNLI